MNYARVDSRNLGLRKSIKEGKIRTAYGYILLCLNHREEKWKAGVLCPPDFDGGRVKGLKL